MQKANLNQLFKSFYTSIAMDVKKWKSDEENRWKAVIEQYNAEIGKSLVEINSLSGKGYAAKDGNLVAITERGIGFVEGTLKSKGINEDVINENPIAQEIVGLLDKNDYELDIMACQFIYKTKYKETPTAQSLTILDGMLKTANIPKSE